MSKLRRDLALSGIRVYLTTAIGIVSSMILARLLTPAEVGVMSVAAGQLAMVSTFRDAGVSTYLITEPELTRARVQTCLGITVTLSWTLAAVLVAVAAPTGQFYGDPRIPNVMYVQSLSLLLIPFNALHLGIIKRERRFDRLLWVDLTSAAVNALTAITLAALGASYMALAWGLFASIVVTGVLVHRFSSLPLWLAPRLDEWQGVARFGGKATALSLISNVSNALPELAVAKLLGIHYAGLLSRAFGVQRPVDLLLLGAVEPVVFSAVSEKFRDGQELASGYLRGVRYMSAVAMPIAVVISLLAEPIVMVMFGPQWGASAALLRYLTLAGLATPLHAFVGAHFMASGGIGTHLTINTVAAPLKAASWLLVLWLDFTTVAAIWSALHLLHGVVATGVLSRRIGARHRDIARAMVAALPPIVGAALVPGVLRGLGLDERWPAILTLAVAGLGAATGWALALRITRHALADEVSRGLRDLKGWIGRRLPGRSNP